MAVIDHVGATCARLTGVATLIPAWLAIDRYTLGFFTGGPVVISVDALRATLYPMLWIALAWLLLNPKTTRSFLFRREDPYWRVLLGMIYAAAIPLIFLATMHGIRTHWLQTIWLADVFLVVLPFVWIGFMAAFSVPGTYARRIAEERQEEIEASEVRSEESRASRDERAFTEDLRERGIPVGGISVSGDAGREDARLADWQRNVEERQERQTALRQEQMNARKWRGTRGLMSRIAVAGLMIAILAVVIGTFRLSIGQTRSLDYYMPVILGVAVTAVLIIGNIGWGARGGTVFGRIFRIALFVSLFSALANFVLYPAGTNVIAILYEDVLAEAVASFVGVSDTMEDQ